MKRKSTHQKAINKEMILGPGARELWRNYHSIRFINRNFDPRQHRRRSQKGHPIWL